MTDDNWHGRFRQLQREAAKRRLVLVEREDRMVQIQRDNGEDAVSFPLNLENVDRYLRGQV